MFWIFIVNDLQLGNITLSAEKVADYLLKSRNWCYSKFAPNVRNLNKGDTVLVYLAGKGRRCFFASFKIDGDISALIKKQNRETDWETEFERLFKLTSPINDIQIYDNPVLLNEELREKVDFIVDKKNCGLYFCEPQSII